MKIKKVDHVYFTCSLFIAIYLLSYAAIFWFEQSFSLGNNTKLPPLINSMSLSALVALIAFPIAYKRYFSTVPSGKLVAIDRTLFTTMGFITLTLNSILTIGLTLVVVKLINNKIIEILPLILFIILLFSVQIIIITCRLTRIS